MLRPAYGYRQANLPGTQCRQGDRSINRSETLDPSDVQELWVKFCRRQGGISAEQTNIFRDLDRRAFQGLLTGGEMKTAEKTLRLLKPPQDKAWFQDEREAEVHRSGCKRQQPHLREVAT